MIEQHAPAATGLRAGRRALAAVEVRRALCHPVLLVSFGLTVLLCVQVLTEQEAWSTFRYGQILAALFPITVGTIATANLIALRADPVDAFGGAVPLDAGWRRQAQLLAGLGPVALVAVAVTALGVSTLLRGGISIGDVQPRSVSWSAPELAQWVLLVAFSWALGSALAKLVPSRMVGLVVAFLVGFVFVAFSWVFQGQPAVALVQLQPFEVELDAAFEPSAAPADWTLVPPGDFTDRWRRVVVSPPMAAGHDVFLVGLTLVVSAVLWTGRRRWVLLACGAGAAALGVAVQALVVIG